MEISLRGRRPFWPVSRNQVVPAELFVTTSTSCHPDESVSADSILQMLFAGTARPRLISGPFWGGPGSRLRAAIRASMGAYVVAFRLRSNATSSHDGCHTLLSTTATQF